MTRWECTAWILGVLGLVAALIGLLVAPSAFFGAWLAALAVWLGWPLGSMALVLTHALTGGRWGSAIRPALLAGVLTMPLLLPAVIPWIAGLHSLYPWLQTETASKLTNRLYLNLPFLVIRGVTYLVVWFGLAALTLRGRAMSRLAPAGLILLALTFTFAAIDMTESLDPSFSSSAYGMIAAAGAVLLALSIAILLTGAAAPPETLADLGKILLGLTVLWAYLAFMQFLIVWESNLSAEAPWYVVRSRGDWGAVIALIALVHFLLPFALLLSPRLQRSRIGILLVAAMLAVMEIVRGLWLVLPALRTGSAWIDIACLLAFFGCTAALAMRGQRRNWVPNHA